MTACSSNKTQGMQFPNTQCHEASCTASSAKPLYRSYWGNVLSTCAPLGPMIILRTPETTDWTQHEVVLNSRFVGKFLIYVADLWRVSTDCKCRLTAKNHKSLEYREFQWVTKKCPIKHVGKLQLSQSYHKFKQIFAWPTEDNQTAV